MPNITIYTAKHCPYSKRLRDFLYEQGIPFDEISVDKGYQQAQELQGMDKDLRTPVIVINDKGANATKYIGWNEEVKKSVLRYTA